MILTLVLAVWLIYVLVAGVRTFIWGRKRTQMLNRVAACAEWDIKNRWPWEWRYDYFMSHGSIWRYGPAPWRRFDSMFPDKSFITNGYLGRMNEYQKPSHIRGKGR